VNSLTQRDSVSNTQIDASRTVTIELDSNTRDLPGASGRWSITCRFTRAS